MLQATSIGEPDRTRATLLRAGCAPPSVRCWPPNRLVCESMSFTSSNTPTAIEDGTTMKFHTLMPTGLILALSLSVSAQAQGVPGGAAHGASVGNQAAGPVGAVIGGVVGGVVGGVEGILGIDPRPSYSSYSDEHTEYRHPRGERRNVRYSRHIIRHPSSYSR
jgi:hypothetical protein